MVLCVDEKTNLQPRPRKSPILAAQPGRPIHVEHEYRRCGALNLFAAFDIRAGQVYGMTAERKRQVEFCEDLARPNPDRPGWDRTRPRPSRLPGSSDGQHAARPATGR
jgi:hypothetical protein